MSGQKSGMVMRQLRRIFTAVLVLLGAILIVPAFSGVVSAHHSNIDASVACDGTVSWKATSWATGPAGTNSDIRVFKAIAAGAQNRIPRGALNAAKTSKSRALSSGPRGPTGIP